MLELLATQTEEVNGGSRIKFIRDVAEAAGITAYARELIYWGGGQLAEYAGAQNERYQNWSPADSEAARRNDSSGLL